MEKERQDLLNGIKSTFDHLVDEMSKFDQDSLNQTPFEGSWTAGQTAEHIIICGGGIPDSKITESHRPYDEKIAAIKELFLNFKIKFQTDPSIAPGPGPHHKNAMAQKIMEIKAHLETVAKTTDLEALCQDMELPTFGFLTRYEWLYFILFHTQRHTHQLITIGKHLKSVRNPREK